MVEAVKNFFNKYNLETAVFLSTLFCSFVLFNFTSLRYPNDDQFILYRYIDNLVLGNGFVYNLNEHVLGATTPLFTIIAAFFKYIFFSIPTPAVVAYLNIIFLSIASVFFFKVSRFFLSKGFSILALFVFILNLSRTIPEGMETPLYILTLFVFLYFLLNKRNLGASVFLSLTLLVRPDAGLIALITGVYWVQTLGIKNAIKYTLVTFFVALPWIIFSIVYFGTFVPQSLLTKLHSKDMVYQSDIQAMKVQLSHMSKIYWGKIVDPDNIPVQVAVNLIPFLILVYIGIKEKIKKDNWFIFAIPILYFISFSASNPIMFPWYLSEMEPFWILISSIGVSFVYNKIPNRYLSLIFLVIFMVGPVNYWVQTTLTKNSGTKITLFELGIYVKNNMSPGDTVGLSNIGIVGYITHAYIVDFIGLVNNYSVKYYPIEGDCVDKAQLYTISPELIKYTKPKWLIASDGEMEPCFREGDWLKENYSMVYSTSSAHVWELK